MEKILNEDDNSDFVLEEDEVGEVLASASTQQRQEISKERLRRGFGKPKKSATTPVTRKFRAEVEELKLRTKCNRCGNVGLWARMSTKVVTKLQRRRKGKPILEEK